MEGIFMDINAVNNQTTSYQTTESTKKASETRTDTTASADKKNDTGVIYEKSNQDTTKTDTTKKIYNADLVAKLKADAEERTSQLRSLVEKMMTKQGAVIASANSSSDSDPDSIWHFLAKGNFTDENGNSLLTDDEIAQAKEDISEDGYWGVEQTSDRILDFAKALSGNDTSKAELLLNAFKDGYKAATKSWGDELPDISKRTYDAVLEKFEKWQNEADA